MTDQPRNRLGLWVTLLVLTALHFGLGPLFNSWFFSPNLLVAAVLVSARELRPGAAGVVGFVLGLLEDSMAVSYFGLATLLLLLLAMLGSLTRDLFLGEEPLFMGTYVFVGTAVYEAVSYLLMGAAGQTASYLLVQIPLDAVATAAVGYLVLPVVRAR